MDVKVESGDVSQSAVDSVVLPSDSKSYAVCATTDTDDSTKCSELASDDTSKQVGDFLKDQSYATSGKNLSAESLNVSCTACSVQSEESLFVGESHSISESNKKRDCYSQSADASVGAKAEKSSFLSSPHSSSMQDTQLDKDKSLSESNGSATEDLDANKDSVLGHHPVESSIFQILHIQKDTRPTHNTKQPVEMPGNSDALEQTSSESGHADIMSDAVENPNLQTSSTSSDLNQQIKTNTSAMTTPEEEISKRLQSLSSDMFHKMTAYLHAEVQGTVEDYMLLEKMNHATLAKYDGMLRTAHHTGNALHSVNQKFVHLLPYLEQIEQIENTVLSLEQAAYKLDAYTKRLEEKFRKVNRL